LPSCTERVRANFKRHLATTHPDIDLFSKLLDVVGTLPRIRLGADNRRAVRVAVVRAGELTRPNREVQRRGVNRGTVKGHVRDDPPDKAKVVAVPDVKVSGLAKSVNCHSRKDRAIVYALFVVYDVVVVGGCNWVVPQSAI